MFDPWKSPSTQHNNNNKICRITAFAADLSQSITTNLSTAQLIVDLTLSQLRDVCLLAQFSYFVLNEG